jgi:hypothetical protein
MPVKQTKFMKSPDLSESLQCQPLIWLFALELPVSGSDT